MSRKDVNLRLKGERTQLRSILSDYRKAKYKCIALAEELKQQMPNKVHFDSVERETSLKMDLLDHPGLVALKNTLVKTLSELFELETEFQTKREKQNARRELGISPPHQVIPVASPRANKNASMHGIDRKTSHAQNKIPKAELNITMGAKKPSRTSEDDAELLENEQLKYSVRRQVRGEEIDMLASAEAAKERGNSQLQQMRGQMEQMKEELERYMMQEQEIDHLVERRVLDALEDFFKQAELVEQNSSYKVIKIFKDSFFSEQASRDSLSEGRARNSFFDNSEIKFKRMSPMELVAKIGRKKDQDVIELETELAKSCYNMDEVVSRISSTLESSEMKLRELRRQRQQVIMEDDVWAELEDI